MPTSLRAARPGVSGTPHRSASAAPWRRAGRALLLLVAVAGLAAAPAGCSHGQKKPATAADPVEPVTVTVENRHATDMVIYVQRGNTRTRLGNVTPGSKQTYTLPLVFSGDRLEVNASTGKGGALTAELLDAAGKPLASPSDPFRGDSLRAVITWRKQAQVSSWKGKPVSLRFRLQNARLFSFAFRQGV